MKTEYKTALQTIFDKVRPLDDISVLAEEAFGHILIEPIRADRDYPPFNRAAMDGYAVLYDDLLKSKGVFRSIGTILPGSAPDGEPESGEAYRIMTGAAVPAFADTVIKIEDVEIDGEEIKIDLRDVKQGANVARQGEDAKKGETVIEPGRFIHGPLPGLLASYGYDSVRVKRNPGLLMIATGEEITQSANLLTIRDFNSSAITGIAREGNIRTLSERPSESSADALFDLISKRKSDFDFIVISGGISKGDTDYVHSVLQRLGVQYLFRGVDMKPGKPVSAALLPEGKPILALPGNPLAAAVTFRIFGTAIIRALTGSKMEIPLRFPAPTFEKAAKNDQFIPARMGHGEGKTHPESVSSMGSGDFSSIGRSHGFMKIPKIGEENSSIEFYPWYSWRHE